MKKLLMGAVALFAFVGVASPAQAYVGDWLYDNNAGGWEILHLGDNNDGQTLVLGGSERYCGVPGVSYQRMRNVISSNGDSQIHWWIANDCGDHVRICVENYRGTTVCSTYYNEGWQ